jgi:hypothetical protein
MLVEWNLQNGPALCTFIMARVYYGQFFLNPSTHCTRLHGPVIKLAYRLLYISSYVYHFEIAPMHK